MLLDDVIYIVLVLVIIWFVLIIDKGFNIFWLLRYEN